MKGIILAGGKGTRLYPLTMSISKQILPVYDKPMIYYPLSVLMLANIREILIISTERDLPVFKELLKDGSEFGLKLEEMSKIENGAAIFGYPVKDSRAYGVVEFDETGKAISLEEKPENPRSNYAIPGLYFYDNTVVEKAKNVKPSARGEIEITTVNEIYLSEGKLNVKNLGRGIIWFDTGTHEALLEASNYVEAIQKRQGFYIACLEEIAYKKGWINEKDIEKKIEGTKMNDYQKYLSLLIKK